MLMKIKGSHLIISLLLLFFSISVIADDKPTKTIENISFHADSNKQGIISIDLSTPYIEPSISERNGMISINLPATKFPLSLQKQLVIQDTSTPVSNITYSTSEQETSFYIKPNKKNFDYSVYQLEKKLVITFWPVAEDASNKTDCDFVWRHNGNVSINMTDTNIRTVLETLAKYLKLNLVMTDGVTGKLTVKMQNIPQQQALDMVLKAKGLAKRQEGNVLIIAPTEELTNTEKQTVYNEPRFLDPNKSPIRRELFPLNYVEAAKVITAFDKKLAITDHTKLRGAITIDKRTNTIIAYLTEKDMKLLKKLVKDMDKPIRQIMIETYIIESTQEYIDTIKAHIEQNNLVDLLLMNMQKQHKLAVLYTNKATTPNKKKITISTNNISCCLTLPEDCPTKLTPEIAKIAISLTPKLTIDNQINLDIVTTRVANPRSIKESTLVNSFNNELTTNGHAIILTDFENYKAGNKKFDKLAIIIIPKVIPLKR